MSTSEPESQHLPKPGDLIGGKYVLEKLLGKGGMGAVYSARHVKLSKAVAIKIMLADRTNPEARTRFINEGRNAANIQNEHVVRVDDVDEEHGYAYMVLELLDGEDLGQLLERQLTRRIAPQQACGYVLEALRGVAQAHALGIVHRDLKPSNLFLTRRPDGTSVVKVLDFGISKDRSESALASTPSALTSTKAMLGSPLYMSPEQLRSSKSVDHRADIWAFGIILYELISGTPPFMGETLGELFAAILETDAPLLHQRLEGVSPGLSQVVTRCLQRRPEHRFQTVGELAQALGPFAVAGAMAGAPFMPMPAGPPPPSSPGFPPAAATGPNGGPNVMTAMNAIGSGTGPHGQPGGTVALGAITPTGLQQSGSGWQRTGSAAGMQVPKSKTPLVIGLVLAGVALVVGCLGIVVYVRAGRAKMAEVPPPVAAVSGTGVSAPTPIPPPAPPPSSSPPVASAPASASAAPAPPPPATTTPAKPAWRPSVKVDPPKPQPSPPEPAPAPKPKPAPPSAPTPTSTSALQNSR